jgi:hypothetical protein
MIGSPMGKRKSSTGSQCSTVEPISRRRGPFDGVATQPLPDLMRDCTENQIERMLQQYDDFAPFLVRQFAPKQMTLGALTRMFGVIAMYPNGVRLDDPIRQDFLNEAQYGVNLCGFWVHKTRSNHKREQIIDRHAFARLLTSMNHTVAQIILATFKDFEARR